MLLAIIPTFGLGVGHFYMGKYKKAFFYLVAPWLIIFIGTKVFVNEYIYMLSLLFFLLLYIYTIVDVWRSFPLATSTSINYSRWYFILLFMIFNYAVSTAFLFFYEQSGLKIRHFIVPDSSMNHTIVKGDIVVIKKGNEVRRDDVVAFHYPLNREVFFVKRVVAVGGDEVMYVNKKLYVHFLQGDSYMEEHYAKEHMKNYRNKLWVENPYMINNKNIYYDKSSKRTTFQHLLSRNNAMEAIYLDDEDLKTYESKNGEKINAFYFKVSPNHYFMLGDNREKSNDSRFWGEVDKELIYGVPTLVYFNIYDFSRWGVSLENGKK